AQHLDQAVVHDLDDHLPRRDRAQDLLADRAGTDLVDERAHDRQRHVGLEQRDANLAQRLRDVAFAEHAAFGEALQDIAEPPRQAFEHAASLWKTMAMYGARAGQVKPGLAPT